jgi:hypothetical protein
MKFFDFFTNERCPIQSLEELTDCRVIGPFTTAVENVILEGNKLTLNLSHVQYLHYQIVIILTTDDLKTAFVESIIFEFSMDSLRHLEIQHFQLIKFE